MTTATNESDPIVLSTATDPIGPAVADAKDTAIGAPPASESKRSSDFEVQIAIQAIASRILGSALLERTREVDSIAT